MSASEHVGALDGSQRQRQTTEQPLPHDGRDSSIAPSAAFLFHLQRTAGNQAVNQLLQRYTFSRPNSPSQADAGTAPPVRSLADIERNYRAIVARGRSLNYNVAADNLEYWLDGRGGVRMLDAGWLRGYGVVTDAERTNQERFEHSLKQHGIHLADGATERFTDHWDRRITAAPLTELFYASGISELSSRGAFTLRRAGRTVTITGSVAHHWHDPYDWNSGQGALVPGSGNVSDDDALALRRAGRGRDYELQCDWTQVCAGDVDIGRIYDSITLTWTGP